MRGWAIVEPEGIATDEDLKWWIDRSAEFVQTLEPKETR